MKNTKFFNHKKLIHHISFLENINVNNLILKEEWYEIFNCFAEVIPLNTTNFKLMGTIDFGYIISEKLFLIKVRYDEKIKPNLIINFNERNFEIKRVINVNELNNIIHLIALEI